MPTPIEDHGGINPGAFHLSKYPTKQPRCLIFVSITQDHLSFDLFKTCLLDRVSGLLYCIPKTMSTTNLVDFHPLIQYVPSLDTLEDKEIFIRNLLREQNIPSVLMTCVKDTDLLHPGFWDILEVAAHDANVSFLDEAGREHMLYCIKADGTTLPTTHTHRIAAYADSTNDRARIIDGIEHAIIRKNRTKIQEMVIASEVAYTPLCIFATKYQTDKSPFMLGSHRHPYTAVYDMFLRPFQQRQNLVLGEVGVLGGSSIRMWREYFPRADIHAFDIEQQYLDKVRNIPGVHTHHVDAGDSRGLRSALSKTEGKLFDILLEDASHRLEHQLIFLRDAIDFIAPGGLLIIEDIFREIPMARFQEAIDQISEKVQNAVMIRPEHPLRWSPGWENDRMLLVWRR
jgi:hypothetical protein